MKYIYAAIIFACVAAYGSQAVKAQTYNTAYGTGALTSNTSGYDNSAFGYYTLNADTIGFGNSAFGSFSLVNNVSGDENTAIGQSALSSNTSGQSNTAVGATALAANTSGTNNTATGDVALYYNSTGGYNIALGNGSLYNNSTGSDNTALGYDALYKNTTGNYNIGVGYQAGYNNPASSTYNIDIGNTGQNTDNGVTRIGQYQTSFYAAGISGVAISSGIPVYINSSGQLGTVNSSIRYKEDVHDMADASSKLLQLRPVTYRYKQAYADGSKPVDYGLIAEEVAQVYPDLVARDASGEIQTVQYQKLTPMLLNEVQKQQHQMEAQQKTIEMLEQRLSALEAATPSATAKTHVAAE